MRSTVTSKFTLALTGLLPGVLLASLALPIGAQAAEASHPAPGVIGHYNAAHEITITGTVQQATTKHTVGAPVGMHLLVSGAQGLVDAHVGPYLSKSTQEALHLGLPIQIVGAMETVNGKQYLLARQLIFGGRLVMVRSSSGFLYRGSEGHLSARAQRAGKLNSNGGVQ